VREKERENLGEETRMPGKTHKETMYLREKERKREREKERKREDCTTDRTDGMRESA